MAAKKIKIPQIQKITDKEGKEKAVKDAMAGLQKVLVLGLS